MTQREFRLPDLGEGLTRAELVRWLVAVGDVVEVDQPLVEVMTEKANVELPSPCAGTVTVLHYEVGDVVEVGQALVSFEKEPADADGNSGNVLVGYGTQPSRGRRRSSRPPGPGPDPRGAASVELGRVPPVVSPVVRGLARQRGLDLARLAGSGPHGLITRADVEAASVPSWADGSPAPGAQRIPIRGVQRQLVERVSRSRREIPEATVWVDVDASGLLRARNAFKATDSSGVSVVALVARFCVLGLDRWPLLNGRVEGDEVVVGETVGLGFAAQTPRGLMVPVVHGADRLTLRELDIEIHRLSAAARAGTLDTADLTGGTFTVNNYGVFGVDGSAAIINHPEVAMVGIGRIVERPWVVEGAVTVRAVTELTLAFDHRVCDGAAAGGFLRFVADCVQEPLLAL